jgi:Ca-activated chloride channel family protein
MPELQLLRPYWLFGLLPVLLIWWLLWRRQDSFARWQRVMDPHLLPHLIVGDDNNKRLRPVHLLLVIWLLTVVALAGPSWRMQSSPFAEQSSLMVVLKTSESMESADVQPSRIERAKQKIHDLLSARPGSENGLVVYSGSAHLVMPLTSDDRIIDTMLGELTPEIMPVDGDALADALQLAETNLQRAGKRGSILVMADAVSLQQTRELVAGKFSYPVQFLSMQPARMTLDPGMSTASKTLDSTIERLTPDSSDIERIVRRSRNLASSVSADAGQLPEDAGYFLLPLLAFLALFWSRRGWILR